MDRVRSQLQRVRELTQRPFGANVIIAGQDDPEIGQRLQTRVAL